MDASHFEDEVGGELEKKVDPPGRRHQSAQVEGVQASQASGGSNMNRIVVGVDIAKRVFQLDWVEPETGKIVALQLKREKFLEHFANRSRCLIGVEACGGSQHWA